MLKRVARGGCPDLAPREAGGLGLLLALAFACSPAASTVPLGLGPLAIAERDAAAEAQTSQLEKKRSTSRRAQVATPAKESLAKADAPASDAKDGDADDAKSTDKDPGKEAAGKDAAGKTPPVRFAGMYSGEDIAVYRLTGYPDQEQRDDKAKIRIAETGQGSVSITLINSADGTDLCELVARVEGNAALIETAQPCFTSADEGSLQAELTSGRAVLDGDQLRMDAEGTLSLPEQELDGDLTYSFEGERQ